jgi:hypothetical protein
MKFNKKYVEALVGLAARQQMNTKANQKHAGSKEEGYERMHDQEGTCWECDSMVLGAIELGGGRKIK